MSFAGVSRLLVVWEISLTTPRRCEVSGDLVVRKPQVPQGADASFRPLPSETFWHECRRYERANTQHCGWPYAAFTVIVFSGFWASAVFGSLTVKMPFEKVASILSASTPSGI